MKTALLASLFSLLPQQDPKTLSLIYQNGEHCNAQVLALDGDAVKLKLLVVGGHMQVKRRLADFTPASAFLIQMEAAQPTGFDQHFAMAKRAAELGLVPQAGKEARAAIESVTDANEAEAKRGEVRRWAADALENLLRQAIGDGRTKEAQHYLKLLSTRLPDLRTEDQLQVLGDMVAALVDQDRRKVQSARQAKLDAKVRQEIERKLKPIEKHIADGDKSYAEAVRKSSKTVASARLCDQAVDHYRTAFKSLQALLEKFPEDEELARDAETMVGHLHDNAIRAALHAANMLTVQSDYKGAMEWANRILAFEPDNAEAKEMVRTIQIAAAAASNDWRWGWGMPVVGGGPAVDPRRN
jgi:tetratricopeptide (TPR) repeat protein